jgi:uncharacterized protein (UPF0262 family)
MSGQNRIIAVEIDQDSLAASGPDAEHERRVAIFDLIEDNSFALEGLDRGPYKIGLSLADNRLVFAVSDNEDAPVRTFILSLSPFRRVIKDYFLICESYYEAIRNATPGQIEAIDMGRRGLHNEGSELLELRLQGKASIDFDTARRLFTLVCALYARG